MRCLELIEELRTDYGHIETERPKWYIDDGWDCFRTNLDGRKMVVCDEQTSILNRHDEYKLVPH